jgi:filamentous hemagglutinin
MSTRKRRTYLCPRRRGGNASFKAIAAVALFTYSPTALAGNILRRGAPARQGSSERSSAEAAAAAASSAQAAMTAGPAQNSLRRALADLKRFQEAQDAARAAAQAKASDIPDGLVAGGLQQAAGVNLNTLANNPLWQNASPPSEVDRNGRKEVTVTQSAEKAILTWETFNVGRKTDLYFDQTAGGEKAASWVVLNRVEDPSARPSRILGSIKADGRVCVVNRNGIIFEGSSQVNASAFLGSTLDFAGANVDDRNSAFKASGMESSFRLETPPPGAAAPEVKVEAGARIGVNSLGQVVLLGGSVRNAGTLEAPDGQVFLAAGTGVDLGAANDNRSFSPNALLLGDPGYRAVNEAGGLISVPRGNITMVGRNVEQSGLLTATTGAKANGSIDLGSNISGQAITLGEGGITQILPEQGGEKVIGEFSFDGAGARAKVYKPSVVEMRGDTIAFLDHSSLYVPSGDVTIGTSTADTGRIYIGAGARLDVSGVRDVEVAMEQNTIEAELAGTQLRDNPALRDGPLRGRTVYFDARQGVRAPNPGALGPDGKVDPGGIAELSGYYDLVERDVAQLMTRGGNLTLNANEMIARAGSTIDLSGGSLRYLDGTVRSSVLVDATGKRVRIEKAVAGVPYIGIDGEFAVNHSRWGITDTYSSGLSRASARFEKGYVEGAPAGTLTLGDANRTKTNDPGLVTDTYATAAFRIFEGRIAAETIVGPKQREVASGSSDPTRTWRERPSGAKLVIQRAGDISIFKPDPQNESQLSSDFDPATFPLDKSKIYQHRIPASWFDGKTFSYVDIKSGYDTDTYNGKPDATVNFAPGGLLAIEAGVEIDLGDHSSKDATAAFKFDGRNAEFGDRSRLTAPGGAVVIKADERIDLGASAAIDLAGRWTNDRLAEAPHRALDGGKAELSGGLFLGRGSLIDVSGGAELNAAGTKVAAGKAGSIVLDVSFSRYPTLGAPVSQELRFDPEAVLAGYALGAGRGGTLTINTPYNVVIGGAGAGPVPVLRDQVLTMSPEFFTRGGFSSYAVMGEQSLTLREGADLSPSAEVFALPRGDAELATGARLGDVVQREKLPVGQRAPMSLTLSTVPTRELKNPTIDYSEDLAVEGKARIQMEDGSTVKLLSANRLRVDGTISTLGGTISLALGESPSDQVGGQIELGAGAELVAHGYLKETPDGAQVRRSVESGGTISITGLTSKVIRPDVLIDSGAKLDVSGYNGIADLARSGSGPRGHSRYVEQSVGSAAGAISITSMRGGQVAGTFNLKPGEAALGGSLQIAHHDMLITTAHPISPESNVLAVAADSLGTSGAGDLALLASGDGRVQFEGDILLRSQRSLVIGASVIGTSPGSSPTSVALESGYVQLEGFAGLRLWNPQSGGTDTRGKLTVQARLIDLTDLTQLGGGGLGGFGEARFISSGDIRLVSTFRESVLGSISAGLLSSGALEFKSAQVYTAPGRKLDVAAGTTIMPSRLDDDPGFLLFSGSSISFSRPDGAGSGAPATPLTFGGRLTVRAPGVTQGGVLRAPLGEIRLEGWSSNNDVPNVSLLDGSITSTSLGDSLTSTSKDGLTVPYGKVLADGRFPDYNTPGLAPARSITFGAPNVSAQNPLEVSVQRGAVVDVSGGGDLRAFSFTGGNGGSQDILSASKGFAVLPSLGAAPAPVSPGIDLQDSRLKVGDVVRLEGVPGLKDGFYTLLPAHYALLPGGLLVQPLGGSFATSPEAQVRSDGAVIASGQRGVSGTQTLDGTPILNPKHERFLVMPQEVFRKYSELPSYSFNDYARSIAAEAGVGVRTAADAGTATFRATKLELAGTGHFGGGENGLVGNLDIGGAKIAVASADRAASYSSSDYLVLDPGALTEFGAGSILLGGTRTPQTSPDKPLGTEVKVTATDVVVDTSGASPWRGAEMLLAAKSVSVKDGSEIVAEGTSPVDSNPLVFLGASADGALLRASAGERVAIARGAASTPKGTLTIGSAKLSAQGSLTLDGSATAQIAPGADLVAKQLDLGSRRVNLGQAPAGTPGTVLGQDEIAKLASSSDLLFRGYDSVDVWGSVSLGSRDASGAASLKSIAFDTGLLQGHGAADETTRITAQELVLRNSNCNSNSGCGGAPASAGSAALTLDVDALRLGPGDVRVAGYREAGGAARTIEARGSGSLSLAGALSLESGLVTAGSGSKYTIDVDGAASLKHAAGVNPEAKGLGGRLSLVASSIALDTSVVLLAGAFEAKATKTPGGTLEVGPNAVVDVSGEVMDFGAVAGSGDQVLRFAPGGTVALQASGDLSVEAGSRIDVSGSERGGASGRIEIVAQRRASVKGDLKGKAAEGSAGGSFSLKAASVDGFGELDDRLEGSGFDESRSFHLSESIALEAGKHITAHDVTLRSEDGSVTIAGTIQAAGSQAHPDGGKIQLAGKSGVSLDATAVLHANAAEGDGFAPASPTLEMTAEGSGVHGGYSVFVDPKAEIQLGGGRRGGGSVVVRAPRDSQVALAASFAGARERVFQGMRTYQHQKADGDLASLVNQRWVPEATAWLKGGGQDVGNAEFTLGTAIVVTSSDDLSIDHDIDLSQAPDSSYLGFVAGKDLHVHAAVSDGFDAGGLMAGRRSYSLSFESGGNFRLERGATSQAKSMIRTGTGDIVVRAGGDLVLGNSDSVIYTAGQKRESASEFLPGGALPKRADGTPAVMGEFPIEGGDIALWAARDIKAETLPAQATSAWLFRYGKEEKPTSWSVVYDNFEEGIGALGGGDIRMHAGRDVVQVHASIPTTGYVAPSLATTVRGGGDLKVWAGGDVTAGVFTLGRGRADVRAGGAVGSDPAASGAGAQKAGVLFGLMDAAARVSASGDIRIEGVINPVQQELIPGNADVLVDENFDKTAVLPEFSDRTALEATALSGSVTFLSKPSASIDPTDPSRHAPLRYRIPGLSLQTPPTCRLASLESSVVVGFTPASSPRGTEAIKQFSTSEFEFLARQDVRLGLSISSNTSLDAVLADSSPERIYALEGSVCAYPNGACFSTSASPLNSTAIVVPKALEVFAGTDVVAGDCQVKHHEEGDLSWIRAGRDIREVAFSIDGKGAALLEAGRNFIERIGSIGPNQDLSKTLESVNGGRVASPTPQAAGKPPKEEAANLTIIAGASGAKYDDFENVYLDPQNGSKAVRTYLKELGPYMQKLGYGSMSDVELKVAFDKLPLPRRELFLDQVYLSELKETGNEYGDSSSERFHSYDRGFRAVNLLFPAEAAGSRSGDVILDAKMNVTSAPADISILAPYGRVAIGSETIDTSQVNSGGVITRRGGEIRIMADQNIDLFTSRVFTLQGGDITMWSTNGSITAGYGSKTSVSNSPLVYRMNEGGVVSIDAFGLQTGAGIGVLDALGNAEDRQRSTMILLAPRGEVNAGDAGIRVKGDLKIAAQTVVGVENIQVSGASSGVPKIEMPNLGALTTASQLTQAATQEGVGPQSAEAAAAARKSLAELPSIITVEVVGYETADETSSEKRGSSEDKKDRDQPRR